MDLNSFARHFLVIQTCDLAINVILFIQRLPKMTKARVRCTSVGVREIK